MIEPRLDEATVRHLFPFHIEIGEGFRIVGCGPSLQRTIGADAAGEPLQQRFRIDRPREIDSLEEARAIIGRPVYLTYRANTALGFKGEFIPLAGNDRLLLICSPLVRDAGAVAELGLTFSEFAPHDVAADFIMMMEAQSALTEDLEDMTRRLTAARDEALRASRAKSAFLAGASHELRTPLNAIIGFSELMSLRIGLMENRKIAEYAGNVLQSGHHLLSIIDDILDLSKLEAGKAELLEEDTDLVGILASCVDHIAMQADEKQVRLVRQWPELAVLRCDERLVRQVVFNLLSNALKFTHPGGQIDVALTVGPNGADLSIADNGIGIAKRDMARLFVPFSQADHTITRRFGGTGLGLSISREIAELHGGRLNLESQEGIGTTAILHLPRHRIVSAAAEAC